MKKAAAIIPARYGSGRFPGKPLARILGKPMIQWVYEGVGQARFLERIIIATDDQRIFQAAKAFGGEAILTSPDHRSGTDRAAEVARRLDIPIIINVQGDEPLVSGRMVDGLVKTLQDEVCLMASLMEKVYDLKLIQDPNINKVVVDREGRALYFSRLPLPYQASDFFYRHVGVYGYERNFLFKFVEWGPSRLERAERLEQLRALENGMRIKMIEISEPTLSVDTPEDIIKVEDFLKTRRDGKN